jgi:putative membrane protein
VSASFRLTIALLALSTVACRSSRSAGAPAAKPASPAAKAPVAGPAAATASAPSTAIVDDAKPLTDANIAAIVIAANNADITTGQLALARSADPAVKQFATMTVRDHQGVNAAASALAGKLRLTPVDDANSLDIRDLTEEVKDRLRDLSGHDFDLAYAAHELSYHARVLEIVEGRLIPQAKNAELRSLLEQTAPAVRMHFRSAALLDQALKARDK